MQASDTWALSVIMTPVWDEEERGTGIMGEYSSECPRGGGSNISFSFSKFSKISIFGREVPFYPLKD